ncbi:unnamed protein product [Phyllotreta striolata]|uniref:Uncharacterized protein n=1 Tax=Phyllotreta striolata TaxID=444603 RepID=A0A9N9THJ5_PHYSR|nr:unnamed protein product [Phyllotreta striolata]
MTAILLLLSVFLYCTVQAAPPNHITSPEDIKEDIKQRERIGLDCLKQIGLNKTIVEKAVRSIEFVEDRKYKEFLACSYKQQGFQSDDGEILYDNLIDYLSTFYKTADLKSLDDCRAVGGSTDGERAFNSMKCIISGLRKIDQKKA